MSNCEKCDNFDESTEDHSILGIPCALCRNCFRSWARRYHKNIDATRLEILSERIHFLKASNLGKPLVGPKPFELLDILVTEREAIDLKLIEDTIDWLEEPLQ